MLQDFDDDADETKIWDKRMKKTMIGAFVFFAAGLLLAWAFGNVNGNNPAQRPADASAREETYWKQITFLNPGFPTELRKEVTKMGWRACGKLESGWSPTQVLAFISESDSGFDADKLPMPATQVQFWIGVEQSAAMSLCPDQESKLDGWLENFAPKPAPTATVTEPA